jgi:dTDP-4-amino-4,6-dideoxygalactose transaminase
VEPVWHLYVIRAAARDRLRATLAADGVQTGIHYPIPIHRQPAYRDLGYPRGAFPVTERYAEEILSLPMYPELDDVAVVRVAEVIYRGTERFPWPSSSHVQAGGMGSSFPLLFRGQTE